MKKIIYLYCFLLACNSTPSKTLEANPKPTTESKVDDQRILSYLVDQEKETIAFYYKNKDDQNYFNFSNLKTAIEDQNKQLKFAFNGGMFKKDFSPLGLYIENGAIISELNTVQEAYGNFYLQPNGIFYLLKNQQGLVETTSDFKITDEIAFASQSGPMLVIDKQIHPKFVKGSKNLNIRNGVGILPNNQILFAMSKEKINLYDFAEFFKKQGCANALYLDGFVSKAYYPPYSNDLGGKFGVMIAVLEK